MRSSTKHSLSSENAGLEKRAQAPIEYVSVPFGGYVFRNSDISTATRFRVTADNHLQGLSPLDETFKTVAINGNPIDYVSHLYDNDNLPGKLIPNCVIGTANELICEVNGVQGFATCDNVIVVYLGGFPGPESGNTGCQGVRVTLLNVAVAVGK